MLLDRPNFMFQKVFEKACCVWVLIEQTYHSTTCTTKSKPFSTCFALADGAEGA